MDLSVGRVERSNGSAVPHDELPHAAGLNHRRRGVSGFTAVSDRPPNFLSRALVERNHLGVRLAAGYRDQQVSLDQRMSGRTPYRQMGSVVGDGIDAPDHLAGLRIETQKISHRAQHVNAIPLDSGRGSRSQVVLNRRVIDRPLRPPQDSSRLFIQRNGPLNAAVAASGFKLRGKHLA